MEKKINKPKKVVFPVIILALIVVIAIGYGSINNKLLASNTGEAQKIAVVKKGNIADVVVGSGSIYSTKSNKIYSKVSGTVTAVNFKAGDKVKAGDVIYEVDDRNAQDSLAVAKTTLEQSQIAADASSEDVSNLNITAPFSGQVSSIAVNKGDTIQKNAAVLTLTDTSKYKVLISFNAADISHISIGQTADVNITSLMQNVKGSVTYISNQPSTTNLGGLLYSVEIQINNPGALYEGMSVNADIETSVGTVSSTGTAVLKALNRQVVISKTGGTVQNILVKENQKVNSGDLLVQMKSDDIVRAKKNADLNVEASLQKVDTTQNQVGDYKITAPIDGVLSIVPLQVGDTVAAGVQVSEVSDPIEMKFDIPVDAIDLPKVAIGQKVNISVSSVDSSSTPIEGTVDAISVKGNLVGGMTTFPVTIKIDGSFDMFKSGMKANAEIKVSNTPDVLYIPMQAVISEDGKDYVMVKTAAKASKNNNGYYAGTERREVELGMKSGNNAEIKNGLKEGEQVVLPIE